MFVFNPLLRSCLPRSQSSSFCTDDGERGGEQPVSLLPSGGVQVIHLSAVMVPVPVSILPGQGVQVIHLSAVM